MYLSLHKPRPFSNETVKLRIGFKGKNQLSKVMIWWEYSFAGYGVTWAEVIFDWR